MGLVPASLKAVQEGAKEGGLDRTGASLTLEGGLDAAHHRTGMFHAGMLPHMPEKPRNRTGTKRGRQRLCKAGIQAWRRRVERTLAWEDKCKRLLRRFARIQPRH